MVSVFTSCSREEVAPVCPPTAEGKFEEVKGFISGTVPALKTMRLDGFYSASDKDVETYKLQAYLELKEHGYFLTCKTLREVKSALYSSEKYERPTQTIWKSQKYFLSNGQAYYYEFYYVPQMIGNGKGIVVFHIIADVAHQPGLFGGAWLEE